MTEIEIDEYLPKCNEQIVIPCQRLLREKGFEWCIIWALNNDHYLTELSDKRDIYSYLLNCITEIYVAMKNMENRDETMNESYELIKQMIIIMKEFDTECGLEEGLSMNQTEEKQIEILEKLDEDKELFKQKFKKMINESTLPEFAMEFLLVFIELIFNFNGYQAPPRTDPLEAISDSLGYTNLYEEMVNEIFEELGISGPEDSDEEESDDEDSYEDEDDSNEDEDDEEEGSESSSSESYEEEEFQITMEGNNDTTEGDEDEIEVVVEITERRTRRMRRE